MFRRLPPILRPRLTLRYILFSAAALYVLYCYSLGMRLFSTNLPEYTGPYSVGTIDLEQPVEVRKTSDVNLKDGRPAFEIETVLFTLFYPAAKNAKSSRPKHLWLPKPISAISEGYARCAHIDNYVTNKIFAAGLWTLAGSITIPALVDVPLSEPLPDLRSSSSSSLNSKASFQSSFNGKRDSKDLPTSEGFPVIIFSHGMASSRTDYTTYCGELASRGYVVAAIEHRDGSSPGSIVMKQDGTTKTKSLFNLGDLKHDDSFDIASLKEAQINFRHTEIIETVRVLREINDGKGIHVYNHNPRREGVDLDGWRGRLCTDDMTIAGHSYGATGVLKSLRGAPSKKLPFQGAIILDPGKSSGPLNTEVNVPVLVIHSNSWSSKHSIFEGRPHFDVVKERTENVIQRGHAAWFLTSLGTSHPSVTDAPLIEPMLLSWTTGSTIPVREGVEEYVRVSEEFLLFQKTGRRTGLLAQNVSHSSYNVPEKNSNAETPSRYRSHWQIHVAPKTE